MTQNASDVEIANQGFAAFRQDLNDVLEDITTLHSGTAAPSTTYANQWWYETDTDKLYIRNEDNDAWIEILTLDQANDHLASLGASITLDGTGNVSIDSGDFTVDTDTLYVDSTNNKVGVGTTTPSQLVHAYSSGTDARMRIEAAGTDGEATLELVNDASSFTVRIDDDDTFRVRDPDGSGERDRFVIDGSGNVGIGTDSISVPFSNRAIEVSGAGGNGGVKVIRSDASVSGGLSLLSGNTTHSIYGEGAKDLNFWTNTTERMRILADGNVLIGKTVNSFGSNGIELAASIDANGWGAFFTATPTSNGGVMAVNRLSSDGELIGFYKDNGVKGKITVSGSLVSYLGGHLARWSRLLDNTQDETILKGTVMTNLDEMIVWSHDAVEAVEAQDAVYDDDGNVVTEAIEAVEAKDAFTEDNEQLNHMAVSSVEGDPNVAGVFVDWDIGDDGYNDMIIAMTGDLVIRIAQGTTVARGDLLMSAGDGTAKPQGDDIVRSKTIAKVTSTNVSHTYDDGSYCVPCVLMAC